jgi:hypothetical protein
MELTIGAVYKVPRNQELPFAGRFITVSSIEPGGTVLFRLTGGKFVCLSNSAVERIIRNQSL